MLPYQVPFHQPQNQIQTEGTNSSAPQQVLQSNPFSMHSSNTGSNCVDQFQNCSRPHNSQSIHPQPHAPNPQCPGPSDGSITNWNNLNGNSPSVPNVYFPSVNNQYFPVQNNLSNVAQFHGQFNSQSTLQNFNPVAASQLLGHLHNISHSPNQIPLSQPNGHWFLNNQSQVTHQGPLQLQMSANMQGTQFSFHNPLQHVNQNVGSSSHEQFTGQPTGLPHGVSLNIPLYSHPMMGCLMRGAQNLGSQNPTFLMGPQFGLNSNGVAHNTQDQHMFALPATGQQQLQRNSNPSIDNGVAQMSLPQKILKPSTCQSLQGDQTKYSTCNVSDINKRSPQATSCTGSHHYYGKKESENPRFKASSLHSMGNANQKFGHLSGKGQVGKGSRKPHAANLTKQTKVECRRSLALSYSEQEIREWRDDRRKNYPSNCKTEKKLVENQTHTEVMDIDAQKRRQQLKEILAKQAELGVEVAELPPNYLKNSSDQVPEIEENRMWSKKARSQKRYGKRQKHGMVNSRFVKKQKLEDSGRPSNIPTTKHKNATLLQKLLCADIKRHNSHLLQAFRFMVLNDFFKDCAEKPLDFPSIIIKDEVASGTRVDAKVEDIKDHIDQQHIAATDDDFDDAEEMLVSGHIGETDCISRGSGCSAGEEGEITD